MTALFWKLQPAWQRQRVTRGRLSPRPLLVCGCRPEKASKRCPCVERTTFSCATDRTGGGGCGATAVRTPPNVGVRGAGLSPTPTPTLGSAVTRLKSLSFSDPSAPLFIPSHSPEFIFFPSLPPYFHGTDYSNLDEYGHLGVTGVSMFSSIIPMR